MSTQRRGGAVRGSTQAVKKAEKASAEAAAPKDQIVPTPPKAVTIRDFEQSLWYEVLWLSGDPELTLREDQSGNTYAFPDYLDIEDQVNATSLPDYVGDGQFAVLLGPLSARHYVEYQRLYNRTLESTVGAIEEAIQIIMNEEQLANLLQERWATYKPDEFTEEEQQLFLKQQEELTQRVNDPPSFDSATGAITTSFGVLEEGLSFAIVNLLTYVLSCYGRVVGVKPPYDKHPNRITSPSAFDLEDTTVEDIQEVLDPRLWTKLAKAVGEIGEQKMFRYVLWRADVLALPATEGITLTAEEDEEPKK